MNLIKLNATDSTNLFLKDLAKNYALENFTVVMANEQTAGKGQMNAKWHSEKGKNLLCTIYVDFKGLDATLISVLNKLIALELAGVIREICNGEHKIKVKWPNDILSGKYKLAGILVENIVKKNKIAHSFIGIGLNINETALPDFLSSATSLKKITKKDYSIEIILKQIVEQFKPVLTKEFIGKNRDKIEKEYLKVLYKLNRPSMFQAETGIFMGIIRDVDVDGLIVIEKEDEQLYRYGIKELKFL